MKYFLYSAGSGHILVHWCLTRSLLFKCRVRQWQCLWYKISPMHTYVKYIRCHVNYRTTCSFVINAPSKLHILWILPQQDYVELCQAWQYKVNMRQKAWAVRWWKNSNGTFSCFYRLCEYDAETNRTPTVYITAACTGQLSLHVSYSNESSSSSDDSMSARSSSSKTTAHIQTCCKSTEFSSQLHYDTATYTSQ